MATGLDNGRGQILALLQNRHPSTDRQKFVAGDYVSNHYTCAKFSANPSTGASVQMKYDEYLSKPAKQVWY